MNRRIINIIITLLVAFIYYYIFLPAINLMYPGFYVFILIMLSFYFLCENFTINNANVLLNSKKVSRLPLKSKGALYGIILILIIWLGVDLFCSPIFNANSYAKRIVVNQNGDFSNDIALVDFNKIPLLDKDSSMKLRDRKMGEKSEWVSQFIVSDRYTQINYNDSIIRVTPIEYAGFIKWITNHKEGIKGYITVNSVNGESNLVSLDKGIKYTDSAYFNEDLMRKLRFQYPTRVFGDVDFEIDNEGNPYYIASTLKFSGIGLKPDVKSVIIMDAITGKTKEYDVKDVPEWVDHVYSADLIIDQVNNWGEYGSGFINSIIGQKNVVNTTEGYNYLAMNDDIYLYTGITSVSTDESNLGFILTNLRTKETVYYSAPGAEEYSAMASAEGLVQEKGYTASFPLLINLNGSPTYLLSLKDNAGLVKMYAFVDVIDYQKVSTNDASLGIIAAADKFINDYDMNNDKKEIIETSIKIKAIKEALINGNTHYYIVSNDNKRYVANINVSKNLLPFLKVGDTINVKYYEDDIIVITEIISK